MIPYARQSIDQADIDAVLAVLRGDWLTQGPAIDAFEEAVAGYCGAAYGVATSNATAALHVACAALDVGPGDLVWTSPISFVASANCALYCDAAVDFVDVDPRTYTMSVDALRAKLEDAERTGRLPKVVIPVAFAGQSANMHAIAELRARYGFKIVEDAAHAIGATYREGRVGDGRYADITILSFHPVKIITTAEGGMALTNDPRLAARLRRLRSHGITKAPDELEAAPDGPWYYEQVELGYNYRLTDLQAALGLAQLDRIAAFLARRRVLAAQYEDVLAALPVQRPWQDPHGHSAFHLYPVLVERRAEVFAALHAAGIRVQVHYIPVYLQPYYRRLGFVRGHCPQAEAYYARTISLPMYADLTDDQQRQVVRALAGALAVPVPA